MCNIHWHSLTLIVLPCFLLSRGQSSMHVLGQYGKENAAAIFELFLECMPEYPLDKPDNEGNTGWWRTTSLIIRKWVISHDNINHAILIGSMMVDVFLLPVLLLAYVKGNANLCRAIVRAGARLGVNNNQGTNIFNYQVATKQLLFRLLGKRYRFSVSKTFTILVVVISN